MSFTSPWYAKPNPVVQVCVMQPCAQQGEIVCSGCRTCLKVLGQERVWQRIHAPQAVWRTHPQLDTCGKLMWTERRVWVWCPPNTFFLQFSLCESTRQKADLLSGLWGKKNQGNCQVSHSQLLYTAWIAKEGRKKSFCSSCFDSYSQVGCTRKASNAARDSVSYNLGCEGSCFDILLNLYSYHCKNDQNQK